MHYELLLYFTHLNESQDLPPYLEETLSVIYGDWLFPSIIYGDWLFPLVIDSDWLFPSMLYFISLYGVIYVFKAAMSIMLDIMLL